MPERRDNGHVWVGAATIPLPGSVVRGAHKRGFYKPKVKPGRDLRVDILEVYCTSCKQGYEKVADKVCAAIASREHLMGGPVGDQRKRAPDQPRLTG